MRRDIEGRVARWVRPEVRNSAPRQAAAGPGQVAAEQSHYAWPEALVTEWLELLRDLPLSRYPDPSANCLTERLRAVMDIPGHAGVVLGNGSDELIQMLVTALGAPGAKLLAPTPSFVMYERIAGFGAMEYVGVPLADDFSLDVPAMLAALHKHQPALLFLAYPNNPTGNLFAAADMKRLIEAAPGLVVIDEAYHAFAGVSFMERLGDYPNLLVMRTISKLGLAGLRLGFLAGAPEWLGEIDKVRLPYNINTLTQASAEFALRHYRFFAERTQLIREERERVAERLGTLPGVKVFPSASNFLLIRVAPGCAERLYGSLTTAGVPAKMLHRRGGRLVGCLQVSLGSPERNGALLSVFEAHAAG